MLPLSRPHTDLFLAAIAIAAERRGLPYAIE